MMEFKDNVLILCSSGKGLEECAVSVECKQEYSTVTHPIVRKNINIDWEKRLEKCSNLFNGLKFRLHRVETKEEGSGTKSSVKLLVGATSYKEFIGTNCSANAKLLIDDGIRDFSNSQAYMADPIGVGAILVSSNCDLVLIRRSYKCAEMPGMLDFPGGHPEPAEIHPTFDVNLENVSPSVVVGEIFASVLKEVRDEVNIPLEYLSPPVLLGIGFNPKTCKRPSMEFYVRCSMTSEEIIEKYKLQTQAESEESTEILTIPVKEILECDLQSFKFFNDITPACQAALFLLKIFQGPL